MPARAVSDYPEGAVGLEANVSSRTRMAVGGGKARVLYELEMSLMDEGVESSLVYDEEHDLFRFPDGRFAFDGELADVELLWRRGYMG